MRPPSYYNSIVKSNTTGHSYSSPDYDSAPRTSSQQLRSSLSNPSSSNYVSRSHLPFVPQSTLVAHCFTGVGSSTRPYGSGSSSGSSYRAGGGSAASSYISSTSSLSSAYSANSSSSLSSSSRPQSSNYRPYSASTTTNYSLTTPSSSSTLLRSSYLSPSSTTSKTTTSTTATARYRPTVSSSYYKPIRLRERPLLTQISRQIASPTPPPPSTSTLVDRISSPVEPTTIHSHSSDTNQEATSEQKANRSEQADRRASNEWSSDIGRNISRNKYLIKFREIDEQPSHARSTSPPYAEATIELPPPTTVPTPEPAPVEAADRLQSTETKVSEPEEQRSIVVGSVEASVEPTEVESTKVVSADKKKKKKPEEMKQPITTTTNNNTITTSEEQTSVKKAPLKREKKNVKLRLRPVGSGTLAAKTAEVEATAATTIIDKSEPDKEVQLVAAAPVPAMGPVLVDSSSVQRTTEQAKPAKAKRPVKPKEDKENRTELASSRGDDTTTTTSTTRKSSQPNDATTIKTKKRTKKESDEQQQQQQQQMVEPKSKPIRESAKSGKTKPKEQTSEPTTPAQPAARSLASDAGVVPTSPKKAPTRIRFREYNYDDFNFLSVLGHGGWGFVILAELKEHDACFAVKCIKKITIVEDDDYDSIMIERKVLALGNIHPFICKLFCTFETEVSYLFFVMEYCPGGDLMFHVQHEGKFTESRCRFYAAEIICAIRFLHNRHIIYRDLKLDNILLDARGHIRLVDFGMCQCRTYREEMLPSNFCGTPEYISPEIIKGVPYNHSVDWWSFGVLLYEMAVGKMPFRGNDENELLWNVCYEQIHYPMFLSKELTSLLKLLLEREPSMRMGMATCKAGDIYDQPYFRGVDWRAVEEMRVDPPFVPEVKSSRDVSNFDSDFTESTCELSPVDEGTLAKIDQKQFQQFPYTNPDIFIFDTTQGHTN